MNTNTHILVGAGGTGSILAPLLYRHLLNDYGTDFMLFIVDGDKVEEKNIARQGYTLEDVGLHKAEILVRRLDPIDGTCIAINEYITPDNISKIIADGDTILIAADNYRVRADIEQRAFELPNLTVINGGNEDTTATTQLYMRYRGKDLTPPLSYMHPEILTRELTRAEEDCMMRAASPDNEQTIAANLMSAAWMLAALAHATRVRILRDIAVLAGIDPDDNYDEPTKPNWHELHASLYQGKAGGPDWRTMGTDAWRNWRPDPITSPELVPAAEA